VVHQAVYDGDGDGSDSGDLTGFTVEGLAGEEGGVGHGDDDGVAGRRAPPPLASAFLGGLSAGGLRVACGGGLGVTRFAFCTVVVSVTGAVLVQRGAGHGDESVGAVGVVGVALAVVAGVVEDLGLEVVQRF